MMCQEYPLHWVLPVPTRCMWVCSHRVVFYQRTWNTSVAIPLLVTVFSSPGRTRNTSTQRNCTISHTEISFLPAAIITCFPSALGSWLNSIVLIRLLLWCNQDLNGIWKRKSYNVKIPRVVPTIIHVCSRSVTMLVITPITQKLEFFFLFDCQMYIHHDSRGFSIATRPPLSSSPSHKYCPCWLQTTV